MYTFSGFERRQEASRVHRCPWTPTHRRLLSGRLEQLLVNGQSAEAIGAVIHDVLCGRRSRTVPDMAMQLQAGHEMTGRGTPTELWLNVHLLRLYHTLSLRSKEAWGAGDDTAPATNCWLPVMSGNPVYHGVQL